MNDKELCAFLELFMTHDDHGLSDESRKVIEEALNKEAALRGYKDWIVAYHSMVWAAPATGGRLDG